MLLVFLHKRNQKQLSAQEAGCMNALHQGPHFVFNGQEKLSTCDFWLCTGCKWKNVAIKAGTFISH